MNKLIYAGRDDGLYSKDNFSRFMDLINAEFVHSCIDEDNGHSSHIWLVEDVAVWYKRRLSLTPADNTTVTLYGNRAPSIGKVEKMIFAEAAKHR